MWRAAWPVARHWRSLPLYWRPDLSAPLPMIRMYVIQGSMTISGSGYFSDGSGPTRQYEVNQNCVWYLHAVSTTTIALTFLQVSLEDGYDFGAFLRPLFAWPSLRAVTPSDAFVGNLRWLSVVVVSFCNCPFHFGAVVVVSYRDCPSGAFVVISSSNYPLEALVVVCCSDCAGRPEPQLPTTGVPDWQHGRCGPVFHVIWSRSDGHVQQR